MRSASGEDANTQPPRRPRDAIADAQTPKEASASRPDQRKRLTSDLFRPRFQVYF
jgi:hypothetical protein